MPPLMYRTYKCYPSLRNLIKPVNFTTFAAHPVTSQVIQAGSSGPAFFDGLALATNRPVGLAGVWTERPKEATDLLKLGLEVGCGLFEASRERPGLDFDTTSPVVQR